MVLTEILEKNAQKFKNKTALTMLIGYRTVSLSYEDVYKISSKVAVFLTHEGLKKGDKVLILAPNSPYWICVWWGALLGGYVPVPLNVQSTSELVEKIAQQTESKIIFKTLYYKVPLPKNLSVFNIEFLNELINEVQISDFKKPVIREEDIAELMYTSGTTGDPKGVILTHKNLSSNLASLSRIISISPKDRILSILPLSHIYEQMVGFLLPFSSGAQIVYAHSLVAMTDLLKEYKITKMAAVPEFLKVVIDKIEAKAKEEGKKKLFDLMMKVSSQIKNRTIKRLLFSSIHKRFGGKLETIASGGAPLDPILEKKWNALGITILQGYGLTETSPIVSCNTSKDHRLGSVGKILPEVEVKIASDGEILVKGPNVFQGYYKNEEKTKEAFTEDGWFKTGDIGELDKDGFLYIKGRKKYMIKGPSAKNVYPEDIEREINKMPGIKDSCVVGLKKPNGQVEIHAVLLGDIKDPEKLIEDVNKKLLPYQYIGGWSIWPGDDFPRSATRKVKKEEVLKWLQNKKTETQEKLLNITPLFRLLAEITGNDISKIKPNTKIVPELNLDSLLRVELVTRIEEKFGVRIDESQITPDTTVAKLEELIKKGDTILPRPQLSKWPRSFFVKIIREIIQQFIIFPLARIFIKLRVENKENLKGLNLPCLFMPNHRSYLDALVVLMALPSKIRKNIALAAARDVLFDKYKYLSVWVELFFNAFPFPRKENENIKVGLEHVGKLLDKGWSVVVFPEGKVSIDGRLQPFKRGAGLMAVEMQVPVVPVCIEGTEKIVPYGKVFPRKRGEVTITFGKPLTFKRLDSYIAATQKLESEMKRYLTS